MATHSSVLAWRIPWTEEPGGLQSMRSQRVRAKLLMGQKGKETDCLRWHKRFSSNQTFFFFPVICNAPVCFTWFTTFNPHTTTETQKGSVTCLRSHN